MKAACCARALALAAFAGSCAAQPQTPLPTTVPAQQAAAPQTPRPERLPTENEAPLASSGYTRPTSAREQRFIVHLMRAAERVRGLRFVRPVPVWVQDRDAIIAYARTQIDTAELERARLIYGALGLLPADIALSEVLLRLLGEQVIGYYDDRNARLIVRDQVMRAIDGGHGVAASLLAEARMTLIHELVHALQDQHLGLSERLRAERDTDSANAFKALYEGDAMLAMSAFAQGKEDDISGFLARLPVDARPIAPAGSELAKAPAIVREPLLFAYADGLAFAAHLFERGGWSLIDRAYAQPPLSTEQVLHPGSSIQPHPPSIPRLPNAEQALGPNATLLHQDTLGELELSVYFGLGSSDAQSRRAAQGWDGDRVYIYAAPAREPCAVWLTRWDSEPDAREASAAAVRANRARGERVSASVVRVGRHVLLTRNTTPEQQTLLRGGLAHWTHH
jgi:hypothetical protein